MFLSKFDLKSGLKSMFLFCFIIFSPEEVSFYMLLTLLRPFKALKGVSEDLKSFKLEVNAVQSGSTILPPKSI